MSINYHGAAMLLSATQRGIRLGNVLTLGRLHVSFTADEADRLAADFDFPRHKLTTGEGGDQYCESLLEALGATSVTSLDFSDYQGGSLRHDLNEPIPSEWKARYELVIDGGTLEHIFNVPVAIRNAMEMLSKGGHYLGLSPSDHWLGHGFYQFSPEWFYRVFSTENGFTVLDLILAEDSARGRIFATQDPAVSGHRLGFLSSRPVESIFLARRDSIVPLFARPPQQSDYSARWEGSSPDCSTSPSPAPASLAKRIAKSVLPRSIVRGIQERAIARKHAAELTLGLRELRSYTELGDAGNRSPRR
jgi:hypothetical protein